MPVKKAARDRQAATRKKKTESMRKALRKSGLTVVAVNTSGVYDAGAKALTEIPKGRYLSYSQRDFQKKFVSAVCAPGR